MVNYSNGKIYRIVDNTNGKQYIGSTTQPLSKRLVAHRLDYKKYTNGKCKYITSFEIIKNNDYSIILIENVNCDNKEQLLKRERHYIESMSCVNKVVPTRTDTEYRLENKEKIKQRTKKYRIDNKEKIKEKNKEYHEINKEKIKEKNKEHRENNKEKIKQRGKKYRENNKGKIQEYQQKTKEERIKYLKEYYQKNKDRYNEKYKEKHNCPCGSCIQKGEIRNHEKSKKHLAYLESLKETN